MFSQSPERFAWLTLWGFFIVFIILICVGTLTTRWFLLSSTQDLQSLVWVGRGTVGIRNFANESNQVAVRFNQPIRSNDTISTDEIAQGYIEFVDTNDGDRVIANALVLPGSQVELISATRPRFTFGNNDYQILLDNFEGRLEVEIPPNLLNPLRMTIRGTQGDVLLEEPGLFLIWSLPDSMTIIPRGANAQITPYNSDTVQISAGQTGTLDAQAQTINIAKTTDELVVNPLFEDTAIAGVPDAWGCYSISAEADSPRGTSILNTIDGRRTLWIQREGEQLGSGETGCRQFFGETQNGLDVTDYRTLRIRTNFRILWHSLSICGSKASECALMIELTYLNEVGLEQRWIHGFYAFDHGFTDVPYACDSCLIEHDRITPGNWYTYETGNLFEFPEGFRPTVLKQIRVYVSGHEYETMISEVSLLGERQF